MCLGVPTIAHNFILDALHNLYVNVYLLMKELVQGTTVILIIAATKHVSCVLKSKGASKITARHGTGAVLCPLDLCNL